MKEMTRRFSRTREERYVMSHAEAVTTNSSVGGNNLGQVKDRSVTP
jgi:hypothetical protein